MFKSKSIGKTALLINALKISALVLTVFMLIAYLSSFLISGSSGFVIRTIPNTAGGNTDKVIAISETQGFSNSTTNLQATPIDEMTNITYEWLDFDTLDSIDGSHNGENNIAYTFYLKNVGTETADISASLFIKQASLNVDAAIRVMVYRNGVPTIYAKEADGGGSETVPEGIVNFENDRYVFQETIEGLEPNQQVKYSIIIWLEGEDPECVDKIRSGSMNLEMNFEILEDVDEEE